MAIERAIYGSINGGIESDNGSSGYQYYTYTPGFKTLVSDNNTLEGRLTTMYTSPGTYVTQEWYYNETKQTLSDRNEASRRLAKEHPKMFGYWRREINGQDKACFVYGKDMGHDWSEARMESSYHSSVICNLEDVKLAPIFYCASPSVCCEIERKAFFPEQGTLAKPAPLVYTRDLNDENEGLKIPCQPGFDPLEIDDIIQFIREEDRSSILQSMLMAIMKNKDGNERCHIVIADQQENILYWIAAISLVFPLDCVKKLSFCTYEYKPMYSEFDINGVFLAELNGVEVSESDRDRVTYYSLSKACESSDAVYDFSKEYYAPNISVEDNPFFSMIGHVFQLKRLGDLDAYKQFIKNETTYSGMGTPYSTGYFLYAYLKRGTNLEEDQLQDAVEFAKKFTKPNIKKQLLEKFKTDYKNMLSSPGAVETIKEYHAYCISNSLVSEDILKNEYMNDIIDCFTQAESTDKALFLDCVKGIGIVSGMGAEEIYERFGESLGYAGLEKLTRNMPEKWKQMFVLDMICVYSQKGRVSLKKGTVEYQIVRNIIEAIGEDNPDKTETLIKLIFEKIQDTKLCCRFADLFYMTLQKMGFRSAIIARDTLIDMYFDGDDSKIILQCIAELGGEEDYLPQIIARMGKEGERNQTISGLEALLESSEINVASFASNIWEMVIDTANSLPRTKYATADAYYRLYAIMMVCNERYRISISPDDIKQLTQEYLNCIAMEHPNFQLSQIRMDQLEEIYESYQMLSRQKEPVEFVQVFFQIGQLKQYVDKCAKNGFNKVRKPEFDQVDYKKLDSGLCPEYLKSMAELCDIFWEEQGKFFDFEDLLYSSDEDLLVEMYESFLKELLLQVLGHPKSKDRGSRIAYLLEISISYKKEEMIDDFLKYATKKLVGKIKSAEVLKPLEKDLETLEKGKKTDSKWKDERLYDLEGFEVLDLINQIKDEFDKAPSTSSLNYVKDTIGTFKNFFKR